jgi:hypothetical protein
LLAHEALVLFFSQLILPANVERILPAQAFLAQLYFQGRQEIRLFQELADEPG